jgi:1-acyl-sn-glycerol-3-phosphate acyltransferase
MAVIVSPPKQSVYPWPLLLLEGLIGLAVGLALLYMREPTLRWALWLLGLYLVASGVLALGISAMPGVRKRRVWLLARGVLMLLAGSFLLGDRVIPGVTISEVALIGVAIVGFSVGVVGLTQTARGAGWGAAVLGIVFIAFGYYAWRYSPALFSHFIVLLGWIIVIGGGATIVLAVRMGLRAKTDSPIKERHPLLGMLRVIVLVVILIIGLALAFPAWLLPIRYRTMKLNHWVLSYTCVAVNWTLRIDVNCTNREALRNLRGMVFPNHVSFLDIPALVSQEPMRFLSTSEVFRIPFIGWMADSIMTVFVDRSSEESRASVREQITRRVKTDANPPFVIFPEGRFGTATSLRPYHRGAFQIAAQSQIPYLPCSLSYARPDIAIWRGAKEENVVIALWRVLTFRGRITVTVTPLQPVHPTPNDDAIELAASAQRATERALGFEPGPTTLRKA